MGNILLQKSASIHPRTSHLIFIILAASRDLIFTERSSPKRGAGIAPLASAAEAGFIRRVPNLLAARLVCCTPSVVLAFAKGALRFASSSVYWGYQYSGWGYVGPQAFARDRSVLGVLFSFLFALLSTHGSAVGFRL